MIYDQKDLERVAAAVVCAQELDLDTSPSVDRAAKHVRKLAEDPAKLLALAAQVNDK